MAKKTSKRSVQEPDELLFDVVDYEGIPFVCFSLKHMQQLVKQLEARAKDLNLPRGKKK